MEEQEFKITNAKQILEIIEPVPAEKFITERFGDGTGNACFLGHIHLHFTKGESFRGDYDGYGARQLTKRFLMEVHGQPYHTSGADVNNEPNINGYTEPVIKDRVLHMLKDMVENGY